MSYVTTQGASYPIWQCSPAHRADKLVGIVLLFVFVQHALHGVKLESQQCFGQPFVVEIEGVVLASCRGNSEGGL